VSTEACQLRLAAGQGSKLHPSSVPPDGHNAQARLAPRVPKQRSEGIAVVMYNRANFTSVVDGALGGRVVEQLLDQVDVGEQHPAAAVARETEVVQRLALGVVLADHVQEQLPFVPGG
jgi:hypothetical protein